VADTTLILGIAGILGTIGGTVAGAWISARATMSVERRREAAERARESERTGREMARIGRLIEEELMDAGVLLQVMVEREEWPPTAPPFFKTERWDELGPALAAMLPNFYQAWWYFLSGPTGISGPWTTGCRWGLPSAGSRGRSTPIARRNCESLGGASSRPWSLRGGSLPTRLRAYRERRDRR
jgi:hypothetical protein